LCRSLNRVVLPLLCWQLDADAGPVEVLQKVVSRIHEELDARPPKTQAWDEKRQRMKRVYVLLPATE
jgi:hypothetical protein